MVIRVGKRRLSRRVASSVSPSISLLLTADRRTAVRFRRFEVDVLPSDRTGHVGRAC